MQATRTNSPPTYNDLVADGIRLERDKLALSTRLAEQSQRIGSLNDHVNYLLKNLDCERISFDTSLQALRTRQFEIIRKGNEALYYAKAAGIGMLTFAAIGILGFGWGCLMFFRS